MQTLELVLWEHPFFKGLEPRFLHEISENALYVQFDRGQAIFREGEDANQFYMLESGRVRLSTGDTTLQELGPGDLLGWSWILSPYRWRFDAVVVEPVKALAFDARYLRTRCDQDHDLGYRLLRQMIGIADRRLEAAIQVMNADR